MKQETLEEAAERMFKEKELLGYTYEFREGIEVGAKWQEQRMYSEKEVIELLQKYRFDLSSCKTPNIGDTTPAWFEKFKK